LILRFLFFALRFADIASGVPALKTLSFLHFDAGFTAKVYGFPVSFSEGFFSRMYDFPCTRFEFG